MFDFGELTIQFECPKCGFPNEATTSQFGNEEVVICRGCKEDIHLVDHLGSVKKAEGEVKKSVDELGEALKRVFDVKLGL